MKKNELVELLKKVHKAAGDFLQSELFAKNQQFFPPFATGKNGDTLASYYLKAIGNFRQLRDSGADVIYFFTESFKVIPPADPGSDFSSLVSQHKAFWEQFGNEFEAAKDKTQFARSPRDNDDKVKIGNGLKALRETISGFLALWKGGLEDVTPSEFAKELQDAARKNGGSTGSGAGSSSGSARNTTGSGAGSTGGYNRNASGSGAGSTGGSARNTTGSGAGSSSGSARNTTGSGAGSTGGSARNTTGAFDAAYAFADKAVRAAQRAAEWERKARFRADHAKVVAEAAMLAAGAAGSLFARQKRKAKEASRQAAEASAAAAEAREAADGAAAAAAEAADAALQARRMAGNDPRAGAFAGRAEEAAAVALQAVNAARLSVHEADEAARKASSSVRPGRQFSFFNAVRIAVVLLCAAGLLGWIFSKMVPGRLKSVLDRTAVSSVDGRKKAEEQAAATAAAEAAEKARKQAEEEEASRRAAAEEARQRRAEETARRREEMRQREEAEAARRREAEAARRAEAEAQERREAEKKKKQARRPEEEKPAPKPAAPKKTWSVVVNPARHYGETLGEDFGRRVSESINVPVLSMVKTDPEGNSSSAEGTAARTSSGTAGADREDLHRKAEEGDIPALCRLAWNSWERENRSLCFNYCLKAVSAGNSSGASPGDLFDIYVLLGALYRSGINAQGRIDIPQAREYLNKADELCNGDSRLRRGKFRKAYAELLFQKAEMKFFGQGEREDKRGAKTLYRKAGNLGHAGARARLSEHYSSAQGGADH